MHDQLLTQNDKVEIITVIWDVRKEVRELNKALNNQFKWQVAMYLILQIMLLVLLFKEFNGCYHNGCCNQINCKSRTTDTNFMIQ